MVGQESPRFQKTQAFGPYLTKAQASDADAVYVFYAGGEAISFVKQYDSFGIKVDKPLYGSGFLTSQLYVNAQGPAAAGVITALHYVPAIDTPENLDFVTSFIDKTGHIPSEFAVHGYDAAHAIVEALKSGATDRESLAKALSQVSFDGPRGELKIDPTTNNLVQPIYVYQTSVEGSQATQTVLATLPAEPDPANGCNMSALMN
jgi:branched-chain amino acid transport system substrate-binding protein